MIHRFRAAALALLLFAGTASAHPLDSLSADEIRATVAALRSAGAASPETRFAHVRLDPPDKARAWDWRSFQPGPRRARVVMRTGTRVTEALVDTATGKVLKIAPRPGVQTAIVPDDWLLAITLVKADPRWIAGIKRRGLNPLGEIFCDALSVGTSAPGDMRRLVRVPCYDARATNNVYGRPIEGLMALVDLDARRVVEVADRGIVPVSTADPSLEQERQPSTRAAMKPVLNSSPAGRNFVIDGSMIRWGAFSLHLSFDQRVGPIVSTVQYVDKGRERRVLYQGHVSEMFVPYMDADPNWSFRSYMDAGEYGFGTLASRLIPGADCPTGAQFLSVTMADHSGKPQLSPDVMCLFERNTTVPTWRRSEIVTGSHEARQDIELVIRTIPSVGNYDYIYDWVFNLKGEIRIDMGATGIAAAKGVEATSAQDYGEPRQGELVGRNLTAPYHDHFLSFRLDMDVDGSANRLVGDRLVRHDIPAAGNLRRSLWSRVSTTEPLEMSAPPSHEPRSWRVESATNRNGLGQLTSYEITGGHEATSLLGADDPRQRRANFSSRALWVTVAKPEELYAAGDYPNQSRGGEGLQKFLNREKIDGADLVLWATMGFHHVTRPEDWPVLSTVRHSLTLRPSRFFDRNPAMNLPRDNPPLSLVPPLQK